MTTRPFPRLLLLLALIMIGGCASDKPAAEEAADPPLTLEGDAAKAGAPGYVQQYNAGQYAAAKAGAEAAMKTVTGPERERAALVAGMSAQSLGLASESQRLLEPLTKSENPRTAGNAAASLGLIELKNNRSSAALALFNTAAGKLTGDHAVRANMYAGDALAKLGKGPEAKARYSGALASASDPALKSALRDRLETGRYTLQLGVFGIKGNAEKTAAAVRNRAMQQGMGAPTIAPRAGKSGQTEYVVQVGRFGSRSLAVTGAARLGKPDARIVDLDG